MFVYLDTYGVVQAIAREQAFVMGDDEEEGDWIVIHVTRWKTEEDAMNYTDETIDAHQHADEVSF